MFVRTLLLLAVLGTAPLAAAAEARPRDKEQDTAFKATQQGHFLSLRAIESRIVPRMRGAEYLGPELDAGSGRYRLKFMREGQVMWVDVDARTGQVIGRAGY
ncbi:MAG TPA: hypothetical protein VGD19_02520 [Allosphingosinicella sp.]